MKFIRPEHLYFYSSSHIGLFIVPALLLCGGLAFAAGMQPWFMAIPVVGILVFGLYFIANRIGKCDRASGVIRLGRRQINISHYGAIFSFGNSVDLESIDFNSYVSFEFPTEAIAAKQAARMAEFFDLPLEQFLEPSVILWRGWNPADWGREARPFFRALKTLCEKYQAAGYITETAAFREQVRKSCFMEDVRHHVAAFQQKLPESVRVSMTVPLTGQLRVLLQKAALANPELSTSFRDAAAGLDRDQAEVLKKLKLICRSLENNNESGQQQELFYEIFHTVNEIQQQENK